MNPENKRMAEVTNLLHEKLGAFGTLGVASIELRIRLHSLLSLQENHLHILRVFYGAKRCFALPFFSIEASIRERMGAVMIQERNMREECDQQQNPTFGS
jgi:hypothetical protein